MEDMVGMSRDRRRRSKNFEAAIADEASVSAKA